MNMTMTMVAILVNCGLQKASNHALEQQASNARNDYWARSLWIQGCPQRPVMLQHEPTARVGSSRSRLTRREQEAADLRAHYSQRRVRPHQDAASFRPAHASCWTVRASWPVKVGANYRGSCSSSRMRKSTHRFVGRFQRRDRLLSGDTRERVEKLLETVVSFEVVDQVAERNTRPDKHGRAAQNVRITVNNWRGIWHWHVGPDAPQF